ncbi:MAG TPA: DNA (cytosine-5-)-methyltransferase [Comamonadaceae bacterium]|nr:MAG: DNA (cytosine-5-)-methyltransferase [Burkholderiales bacterium RIFCSPLOWO2_12_FULL_65_40]HCE28453.1 DNA (cytosine-5-)-methyltransferase [Comamonadaceae bacterium]
MLTPQYILPTHPELVVDLFAGGGGASTGIEQAIGRHVDVAVNHDTEAVSLHTANHPQTRHFCSDVFEVDPLIVTDGQPVGLLWASPDCKHFSKAKGGKPVSKKIRSLAWVVVKWAKAVRPRVICLENVEEFQTWGPLADDGRPCPQRKGQTFALWKKQLQNLGYQVEHRELRACDYGAPTSRKRLFLVARCDGQPIVWPSPTHAQPDARGKVPAGMKPWRTAADCIDWTVPAPSIFERTKPLADATCRRIAKGIMRYVVDAKAPFVVATSQYNVSGAPSGEFGEPLAASEPPGTVENRARARRALSEMPGSTALSASTLIQTGYGERPGQSPSVPGLEKPLGTVVAGKKHALVTAFLAKHYTGVVGSSLAAPMGTATTVDHHSLVAAHLVHMGHGEGACGTKRFSHGIRSVEQPLNTVTAQGAAAGLVTSHMVKLRGDNVGAPATDPVHTISAQGTHHGEVRAFLVKYYGTDQDPALREPLHTVTTKDRFGLVLVHGEPYAIVDIGLRMLTPRELYRAQGFPESYRIDRGAAGEPITKTAQVRMCGNSVCPPLARALVAANYAEVQQQERRAA